VSSALAVYSCPDQLATLRETTVRQIHDDTDLSPSEYNPAEHSPRINI
jgi:hypothetical protein